MANRIETAEVVRAINKRIYSMDFKTKTEVTQYIEDSSTYNEDNFDFLPDENDAKEIANILGTNTNCIFDLLGLNEEEESRNCSECNKVMSEGYVVNGGEEYYCKDECLHKHYTAEQWVEMHNNGESDSYYTQWNEQLTEQPQNTVIGGDLVEYLEIHYEVVSHFNATEDNEMCAAYQVRESKGMGGLYELAKEWTDEFIIQHKETDFNDVDWVDNFENFLTEQENKFATSKN
jgi:hypothetical protein